MYTEIDDRSLQSKNDSEWSSVDHTVKCFFGISAKVTPKIDKDKTDFRLDIKSRLESGKIVQTVFPTEKFVFREQKKNAENLLGKL